MTTLGVLYTLGYGGISSAEGLRRLIDGTKIEVIFDVRLHKYSYNLAFSHRTDVTVNEAGVDYVYLRDLGNLAYKTGGTQIKDIDAIERVLAELRAGRNVALMCACPKYGDCHREDLAWEAARRLPGLRVVHLIRETNGSATQRIDLRVGPPPETEALPLGL